MLWGSCGCFIVETTEAFLMRLTIHILCYIRDLYYGIICLC
nr:MAG TPA: hypothetical protein [Caudoviricetes sp.]